MKKVIAELECYLDDLLDLRADAKKQLDRLKKIEAEANAHLERLKKQAAAPGEIALPTDYLKGAIK